MTQAPSGIDFRPIESVDVDTVLEIIRQHDEDDFEAAQSTYERGLDDQFVLTRNELVIGVTGGRAIEDTDRSYWLSWTYLDSQYQRHGLGRIMIEQMIDTFRTWNARKVFATTSDYVDPAGGAIYHSALELYKNLGFREEVRHPHYYDQGETMIALGLRLEPETTDSPLPTLDERPAMITDLDEIDETDDAYYIDWEFTEDEDGSSPTDLEAAIQRIRKRRGRVIFASAPSRTPRVASFFLGGGFYEEGRLKDFYQDGVDEIHYRLDLM